MIAGEVFAFACNLAELAESPSYRAICLAGIGWEILIAPLLLKASKVKLIASDCSECALGPTALPIIERTTAIAKKVSSTLQLGEVTVLKPENRRSFEIKRDPVKEKVVSRRELFTGFIKRGQELASDIHNETEKKLKALLNIKTPSNERKNLPWRRELIRGLLGEKSNLPEIDGRGFAGKPMIEAGRCNFCGVCGVACPTGAIVVRKSETKASIAIHPHRCTDCGLCEKACKERALKVSNIVDFSEWVSNPLVVERKGVSACRLCGGEALDERVGLCAPCYREGKLNADRRFGDTNERRI
ncbi:MAG: hypothetical protein Kow0090_12700 [Myxococcota bacterium]